VVKSGQGLAQRRKAAQRSGQKMEFTNRVQGEKRSLAVPRPWGEGHTIGANLTGIPPRFHPLPNPSPIQGEGLPAPLPPLWGKGQGEGGQTWR
jgi:hypothetical protein